MKRVLLFFALGAVVFSGCSKMGKKLEVSPSTITVYSEGTSQITTNVEDATFSSADEFYATVDEHGLVTGEKVGETEIRVSSSSGTATIPATIMHKYSLYPDLDPLVGKTVADMTKLLGSNYDTSTSSSGQVSHAYKNPTSYCEAILCMMEGSKIGTVGALISTANTSMLSKHLVERYTVAGMQNDYYFFLNHDKNVTIVLNVYSYQYLMVLYMPYTPSKASCMVDYYAIEKALKGFNLGD